MVKSEELEALASQLADRAIEMRDSGNHDRSAVLMANSVNATVGLAICERLDTIIDRMGEGERSGNRVIDSRDEWEKGPVR